MLPVCKSVLRTIQNVLSAFHMSAGSIFSCPLASALIPIVMSRLKYAMRTLFRFLQFFLATPKSAPPGWIVSRCSIVFAVSHGSRDTWAYDAVAHPRVLS